MSGIFDEFSGSLTADVLNFNADAIPEPDTLFIRMTRGERRIADELHKQFGGFKRVVIDVDGERHEFGADSLIRLLESYEQVPELGEGENDGERESYGEACGDDRFELIGKAKGKLLECTNIEMRPDEMAVIDSILFRCWQMGWLDQLREDNSCAKCAEGMGRYADSLCDPLKQRIAELEEQRDVLLRCLENDYGIRVSWDGLRRVWLTESATAELDYIENKSRWFGLFGTPERAARTLEESCHLLYGLKVDGWVSCAGCPVYEKNADVDDCCYSELLEWLRG